MSSSRRTLFVCLATLLAVPVVVAQLKQTDLTRQMQNLRALSDTERPAATKKLAHDISTLPPGQAKVTLAYSLANLVTEGDQGADTRQAVGDVLSQSLAESPIPAEGDKPSEPYMELASLVRYVGVTTTLSDPLLIKAGQILAANDADIENQDFTLKDLHNKPVTLSSLKGKIVLINFWATWCPPCRAEMPALDSLATRFKAQGLVVLSITDEDTVKVSQFLATHRYSPTVLLDSGDKVHSQFHIEGIPKTYFIGRDGKLVGETIDECTDKQFLAILSKTDLHP